MGMKTPLFDSHLAAGARMVDFGGWDMPINYGSQIEEHHAVRRDAGMFDVSHMTVVQVEGGDARAYLRHLLANDVAKLTVAGKALYSCMLNQDGGIVDDLITYYLSDTCYRVVVNASTREKDLDWMAKQSEGFDVSLAERTELAMVAVQGPNARKKTASLVSAAQAEEMLALKPFSSARINGWFVARTGYTGEDGFEIMVPEAEAGAFWNQLIDSGVAPCGLGARDTLRLEAGMSLYGQDMDESTSPLVSALGWTVAFSDDREFVGQKALEAAKAQGVDRKLVGLVLSDRGVLRPGQVVHTGADETGITTSGSYSPSLEKAIALARVPKNTGAVCEVDIRGKLLAARVVKPPFVRNGKACDDILKS